RRCLRARLDVCEPAAMDGDVRVLGVAFGGTFGAMRHLSVRLEGRPPRRNGIRQLVWNGVAVCGVGDHYPFGHGPGVFPANEPGDAPVTIVGARRVVPIDWFALDEETVFRLQHLRRV